MTETRINKIDVFSLILGVLVSLAAQGIWDAVLDYETGKSILDVYVGILLALIVMGIIINVLVFYWLKGMINKRNGKTSEENEKEEMKVLNAILKEQQKTNEYLMNLDKESKDKKAEKNSKK